MRAGDWSPVQWYDAKLAEAAAQVRQAPGLCQLTALCDMGPAGQGIRDAFEQVTDGIVDGRGCRRFRFRVHRASRVADECFRCGLAAEAGQSKRVVC